MYKCTSYVTVTNFGDSKRMQLLWELYENSRTFIQEELEQAICVVIMLINNQFYVQ